MSAQTTGPVLSTSVKILAMCLTSLVEVKPNVRLSDIVLYAHVPLDGLAIHMTSASNVGLFLSFSLSLHTQIDNFADECERNPDCPVDKACISQECADPCLTTQCGQNADCQVDYHNPKCVCRQGLQGNPYVRCLEVDCRRDEDCGDREVCNLAKQECEPLCQGGRCAEGARCEARNHRETCTCNPPLQGDGFAFCTARKKVVKFLSTPLVNQIFDFVIQLL